MLIPKHPSSPASNPKFLILFNNHIGDKMMIRLVNEKDRQVWVSEQHLKEMKRTEEAHKSK